MNNFKNIFIWLGWIIFIVFLSCSKTVNNNPIDTPITVNNKPKYKVGDCVKYNPDLVEEWETTEGLPILIVKVGKRKYEAIIYHPKLGYATLHPLIKTFDEDFILTECSEILNKIKKNNYVYNK